MVPSRRLLEIIEIDCKPIWSKVKNDNIFRSKNRILALNGKDNVKYLHKITMRDVSDSIKKLFQQVSLFLYFFKCVLIKQFKKSYLPVEYIKSKLSIFNYTTYYNTQEIELKGVQNIILRGFIFANTFKPETNPNIWIGAFVMDIYTLCRMFAKFDSEKEQMAPKICQDKFYSPTHNIFFGGALHSKIYFDFLQTLSVKGHNECGVRPDPDSKFLESIKNYVELPDYNFFSSHNQEN